MLQILGLYCANLARLIKPQGPQFHLELDFCTAIAADRLPGWEELPFMVGSGRVVRSSVVDLKAMASGKAPPPEKAQLEKVTQGSKLSRRPFIWGKTTQLI